MQTLRLCEQYSVLDQIPYTIGKELGYGYDGQLFDIPNTEQVIKISVRFDAITDYDQVKQVLNYLIKYPLNCFVKVYDYHSLGVHQRPFYPSSTQDFILYYYVMEKLYNISEDEKKIFHTVLSHEDRGIFKNYNHAELHEILINLNKGLDFNPEVVKLFCEQIQNAPIKHLDMHPRNIMKDKLGNYKFIDLDRASLI